MTGLTSMSCLPAPEGMEVVDNEIIATVLFL